MNFLCAKQLCRALQVFLSLYSIKSFLTIRKYFARKVAIASVAAVALAFAAQARAESFGINFLGNTTGTITGSAGVVPITNWNNIANSSFSSGSILSSDRSVSASLALSGSGRRNGWNNGTVDNGGDGSLMRGYIDAQINGPATATISGLTGSAYTVYIYTEGDTQRPSKAGEWLPNYTINGTRYYTATAGGSFGGYVQGTTTSYNLDQYPSLLPYGNYLQIDNVAPSGGVITISANSDNLSYRSPFNGIEIVAYTGVPQIKVQPVPQRLYMGASAQFTVSASGITPLSYCWRKNKVNLNDGGNISGSKTTTLTLTNLTLQDTAAYDVVVTNVAGSITSVVANLDVAIETIADTSFDAYNAAFLVKTNGLTYYKTSLTNSEKAYFWLQALEIQTAEDVYDRTKSAAHKKLVGDLLTTFLAQNNDLDWSWNDYNDDLGWANMAFIRGYRITGDPSFLYTAATNWNRAYNRGWDSLLGGGVWWDVAHTAKSALSNNPLIISGCELYEVTGDASYLTKSQAMYAWMRTNLYDSATGRVWENVQSNGVLTTSANVYNMGAFINAANCLYRLTGSSSYYNDALLTANYVVNNNDILSNGARGESSWADQFMRGFNRFVTDNHIWNLYYPWVTINANAAWNSRRSDLNITWNAWKTSTATDDCSSLECVSAVVVQQIKPATQPDFVNSTNKVTGTIIGTAGSWANSGNTIAKVFDNNVNTFYDAANATGDWAGLDFGAGVSNVIGQINYWPRTNNASRMLGGVFQGDNSPTFPNPVTLYTITTTPPDAQQVVTSQTITNTKAFRYVRYLGPPNGWCNVAEVQFFTPAAPSAPDSLSALAVSSSQVNLSWGASIGAVSYTVKRASVSGGPYSTLASGLTNTVFSDMGLAAGTYYYIVSAINNVGSTDSAQASATITFAGYTVSSPDGNITVAVDVLSGNLVYSVSYLGRAVVEYSPLGVVVNNANLGSGVTLAGFSTYSTNETFASRNGIHAIATNCYQAGAITINHAASGYSYAVNTRVYNNGVAFRYEFTDASSKSISAETSGFVIPSNSTVWFQKDIETMYYGANITSIPSNSIVGQPVLIQLSGTNGFVALTESTLGIFGNPYLTRVNDRTGRLLQVAWPINADGTTVISVNGPVNTPWNVIMVGADLGMMVNNDIVDSVAPAPDPALFPQGTATSWATMGRSVWDYLRPLPGGITYTNAMTNSLWASRMGFEYNTIDEGWANWNGGNPWPQVQQVTAFSHAVGVKVILWKTSSQLNTAAQRATFFQQLQTYGADGFKADFFDFNGVAVSAKERVQLEESILREAVPYHLVVNFHGTCKPTGQFRTYPNLLNFECIFGKEMFPNPWMIVTVPFMRFLAGPADFTPMEFGGNIAFEIAHVVNMPSPIITLAERSDRIATSPFASLIRTIPCQWDQTIVLSQSKLGQTTATARRKGQDWYIGIMNATVTNQWNIPLTFLDPNITYQADIIRQNSTVLERTNVTRDSVFSVSVTTTNGSGFVARIYQTPTFTVSTNFMLQGAIIGTSGSWGGSGNTKEKVFDVDLNTYFDSPNANGDWVGLDLGSGNQKIVSTIRYCPRANWASRMVGGVFQGANTATFSDAVTLYTVGYTPAEGGFTTVTITNNTPFRYVRYLSPDGGSCNVAEVQFYQAIPTNVLVANNWDGAQLKLSWPYGVKLLEATNVTGPWTTNTSASSPFFVTPTQAQKFYRLLVQ